jgi:hypothetical protein
MNSLRKISLAAALVATLGACAQTPTAPATAGMPGMASTPSAMADRMSKMDAHMKAMREMHDKMARARTPEERNALMTDHMKLMQDGMAMMGGMKGMGGMGAMSGDMAGHQQMMEKRMEMMQSMMQMMMDRMPATPAR